jgi:hypothetical protein
MNVIGVARPAFRDASEACRVHRACKEILRPPKAVGSSEVDVAPR